MTSLGKRLPASLALFAFACAANPFVLARYFSSDNELEPLTTLALLACDALCIYAAVSLLRPPRPAARWFSEGVFAAALVVLVGQFFVFWPYTPDDTFISLRYSKNLADVGAITWNAGGEHIEGYTSFLWVLLLTPPHLAGVDALVAAKLLSCFFMLGAVLVTARVAFRTTSIAGLPRHLSAAAASIAAMAMAIVPMSGVHGATGMETTLAIFLVAVAAGLSIEVVAASSPALRRLFAVCLLLLGLTRPDANLFGGCLSLVVFLSLKPPHRAALVKSLLLFYVLPGAAYFAIRWSYYHCPLPLPFYIKGGSETWQLLGKWKVMHYCYEAVPWLVPIAFALARARRLHLAAPAIAAAVYMAYWLKPLHIMGYDYRFLFPVWTVISACAAVGIVLLFRQGCDEEKKARDWVFLAVCLAGIATYSMRELNDVASAHRAQGRALHRAHVALANTLRDVRGELKRDDLLLSISDAGAVPYYSEWITIDHFGLNNRNIAYLKKTRPEEYYDSPPDVVVVLSYRCDKFHPFVPPDEPAHAWAERNGYKQIDCFQFEGYNLLVLAKPGSEVWASYSKLRPPAR